MFTLTASLKKEGTAPPLFPPRLLTLTDKNPNQHESKNGSVQKKKKKNDELALLGVSALQYSLRVGKHDCTLDGNSFIPGSVSLSLLQFS